MSKIKQKLDTLRELVARRGVGGTARHIVKRLVSSEGDDAAWLIKKGQVDQAFDGKFDIDTRGVTQLSGMQVVGKNRLSGYPHIASDPGEFEAALDALKIRLEDFVFIDCGSGKGRAVLLALQYPFRRIIGVEFALEFHQVAAANLARLAAGGTDVSRITVVHADITEFDLPLEPLVLYLYNPFDELVMGALAERVARSLAGHPRQILVLYLNPFHERLWTERGFRVEAEGGNYRILAPVRA